MEMMDYNNSKNEKIVYAIIGSGWRAKYYLRIAKIMPELFEVCGLVTRSEDKGFEIEKLWGIKTYRTIGDLLKSTNPRFTIVAVSKNIAKEVIRSLSYKGIPILAETPPATSIEDLLELNELVSQGAEIQVAEQYYLQPMNFSRLQIINSGILGEIKEANISVCKDYHGISLLRKCLGIKYEKATINAFEFTQPVIEGPQRTGLSETENIVNEHQVIAYLNFGTKLGIYDYANNQHRSFVRSIRFLARGYKGELKENQVKYLKNFESPVEFQLQRINAGVDVNLEGYFLKGVLALDNLIYKNPFIPYRLADDEIAVATCLIKMNDYVVSGKEFYSLAESSQDIYLSLMINNAVKENKTITTEIMPWAVKE